MWVLLVCWLLTPRRLRIAWFAVCAGVLFACIVVWVGLWSDVGGFDAVLFSYYDFVVCG